MQDSCVYMPKKRILQYLVLAVLILLPTIYYSFLATDMYVSTAKFAVRGHQGASMSGLMEFLGGTSGGNASDSYIVADYIQSESMLERVNVTLDLKEHYSQDSADFHSRLNKDATREQYLSYWNQVVRVSYDSMTSVLTLEVRAYTPEMAQAIGREVIAGSESLMNHMNQRAQKDTLKLVQKELELAEKRYATANRALNEFRERNNNLDPTSTANTRIGIIAGLEASISKLSVELHTQRQFMNENSFAVQSLKKSLAEQQAQLEYEKSRVTGENDPEFLSLLTEYEGLELENEFAKSYYLSALSSAEKARLDIESKSVYLEPFQAPTLPDEPMYPERLPSIALAFVVVIMGYALILMIIASIREHIGA